MTPDKVEEIIHNLELCECEHISGELQSERIRLALTQYHQDLMSEVVENAYKKGYVDGFLKTGEGYNGEYMQGAKDRHNVTVEDVFATLSTEDILTEARNIIKFK